MSNKNIIFQIMSDTNFIQDQAKKWLSDNFDTQTRAEVARLIDSDPKTLNDSFYKTLEFGTGGLRGIMGVGTNRMNVYTVGMATQGLANYLLKTYKNEEIKVAVAYDCRNNSPLFAQTTADVFAANGFTVYLFESLRPTPELSFTIRELGCKSGVVVTASHNPKEYNGYKAYWCDGAQVIEPHDTNIIDEVNKISDPTMVKKSGSGKIITIGEDLDGLYIDMIKKLSLSPDEVAKHNNLKIVYTPIHGTGVKLVPRALKEYGFKNIINVPQQDINDGNFPTVVSPNPEESEAMKMGVARANETGADLVMATDPDADRQAIAVRDESGAFRLLNGNQSAVLLTYYLVRRWKELGKVKGNQFVVKTIVTTDMIKTIAKSFGVECFEVLTGFKYIADVIAKNEGVKEFIGGGEESFGYLVGDAVRDKDAVASLCMAAECAAWAKEQGMTLWQLLKSLYVEFGFYKEGMVSITKPGQSGLEEIAQMMVQMRANHPTEICGSKVIEVRDYQSSELVKGGVTSKIDQPKSNVLQFVTEDETIVSVRPSGTEPKIKFYFGVRESLCCVEKFDEVNAKLDEKIEQIKHDLKLK